MREGDAIPDDHDVVRYVGGSKVNEYGIDGSAFELREEDMRQPEPGLSCNWLDYFVGLPRRVQVARVRGVIHMKPGRDAVFGELNVKVTLEAIGIGAPRTRFIYKPKPAQGNFPDDFSHCELLGLPDRGTHESELMGDKIAKLVKRIHRE